MTVGELPPGSVFRFPREDSPEFTVTEHVPGRLVYASLTFAKSWNPRANLWDDHGFGSHLQAVVISPVS